MGGGGGLPIINALERLKTSKGLYNSLNGLKPPKSPQYPPMIVITMKAFILWYIIIQYHILCDNLCICVFLFEILGPKLPKN